MASCTGPCPALPAAPSAVKPAKPSAAAAAPAPPAAPAAAPAPAKRARKRRAAPAPATQAATPDATPPARSALTPEVWIEAATQVLVDQGIDHVRVDVLAGELGVTRGSFYWHFRDREDLLRRVLQAWRDSATVQLTQRLLSAGSPLEQLRDVISLPFRGRAAARAARIELAIRAWARRDEMARQAVDAADAARIAYHADIFRGLGFGERDAQHRAFVLYSCEVAESLLHRQGSAAQRQERQRYLQALVLSPLAQPAAAAEPPRPGRNPARR